jgi:hypothetical protein
LSLDAPTVIEAERKHFGQIETKRFGGYHHSGTEFCAWT